MKSISKNLSKLFPSVSSRLLSLRFYFNVGVLFLIVCCGGILKLLSLLYVQQPGLVGLVGSVAAADHQVVEIWISLETCLEFFLLFHPRKYELK